MNDLHPPRKLRTELGPGWIMMALAQGSGELIWWPYLVGKYGVSFLWLLPIAALMQLPINYFLGRYTLTTGETFFAALFRNSKAIAAVVWVLFLISFLWFGAYASAAGTALGSFLWPAGWVVDEKSRALTWATILMVLSITVIIIEKQDVLKTIEKIMMALCIATVGLIALAVTVPAEVRSNYGPFVSALFPYPGSGFWHLSWLPRTWETRDWPILVSALLFTGMGGFWNVFYSYWVREKKWGSAGRRTDYNKFSLTDSPANMGHYARWLRVLRWDVTIGIVGNMLTTIAISLLALTYLVDSEELPGGWRLVVVQSRLFHGLWGWGPRVFIALAAMFLIDTWITTADAVARIHLDALREWFPSLRDKDAHGIYMKIIYVLAAITFITMFLATPKILFLINGVISAFAMILVGGCIYYLWRRLHSQSHLPGWTRPGLIPTCSLLFLSLPFYVIGFALYLVFS